MWWSVGHLVNQPYFSRKALGSILILLVLTFFLILFYYYIFFLFELLTSNSPSYVTHRFFILVSFKINKVKEKTLDVTIKSSNRTYSQTPKLLQNRHRIVRSKITLRV